MKKQVTIANCSNLRRSEGYVLEVKECTTVSLSWSDLINFDTGFNSGELPQLFNMPKVKSIVILFYGNDAEFRIVAGRSFIQNMNEIKETLKMLAESKRIKLNFLGEVYK